MATTTKTAACLKDENVRYTAAHDKGANGHDHHLIIGKHSSGWIYRALLQFNLNAAFWSGVYQIVRAELVLKTTGQVHVSFGSAPGIRVWRCTSAITETDADEGVWHTADYPSVQNISSVGSVTNTAINRQENYVFRTDVTAIVEAVAPTTVRKRDGNPGGAQTNHGIHVRGANETDTKYVVEVFSRDDPSSGNRPYLELTYEQGPVKPNAPTLISPLGDQAIPPSSFTGTFSDPNPGDVIVAKDVEVTEGGVRRWASGIVQATPAEQIAGTFSVPYPDRLLSLTNYGWAARVFDGTYWSDWSATQAFRVLNTAPVLTINALTDRATLAGTKFGAKFSDPDGDRLFSFQVQMRPQTAPGSPLWEGYDNLWDTGLVYPTSDEIAKAEFGTPYGGGELAAAAYSWRVRAYDHRGAVSPWVYDDFTLTADFNPDPGAIDNLTVIRERRPPAKVVFRSITLNVWRIVTNSTGGHWHLVYGGLSSGELAYNVAAASVKSALEALIPGVTATVTLTTDVNARTYDITLSASFAIHEVTATNSLTGGTGALSVTCLATRAPGPIVAEIEDPAGLGGSTYLNAPGEFHMTLPQTHPQISAIEPWFTHYSLQYWWGDRYRPLFEGLVTDFDATENDVVFYGIDYLGLLDWVLDERYDVNAPDKPHSQGGSKYVDQEITTIISNALSDEIAKIDSPLRFISVGSMDVFSEHVTIYATYLQRLSFIAGLIDSHKQGTGKKSRVWVERTAAGAYRFRLADDVGKNRDNLLLEYGSLIQGYHLVGFGDFAVIAAGIGRTKLGASVMYRKASAPGMSTARWGRTVKAYYFDDLSDASDLERRVGQRAASAGRVGKRVALGIRVDSLEPFDGYDIGDSLPVRIQHGVIDTTLYGSGYWTLVGVEWSLFEDGHTELTLVILPREDGSKPAEDLIPFSSPIASQEWAVGYTGPDDTILTNWYFDTSTGNIWVRDPVTGEWVLYSTNPNVYFLTEEGDGLRMIKLEDGKLWVSTDGGVTWTPIIDADGADGGGIGKGNLPGGSNLIPDGSFEMVAFPTEVPTVATWDTDVQWNDTDPADGQRAALSGMVTSGTGAGAVIQLDAAS